MSRQARVVAEGVPHHITQRGNNRQDVFLLDEDRRFYIEALRAQSDGAPIGNVSIKRGLSASSRRALELREPVAYNLDCGPPFPNRFHDDKSIPVSRHIVGRHEISSQQRRCKQSATPVHGKGGFGRNGSREQRVAFQLSGQSEVNGETARRIRATAERKKED